MSDIQSVQCLASWCAAYSFCSHAKEHKERTNCYIEHPEKRRQCPLCQPMENKDGF